ncbi:hypothetical protein ASG11_11085 [Sphingomonas sp. Leaf357]|uniref:hypothetical protein n=1 Tax=Sphingomonas sp. Leaf357 TaxID=1736350 RepID=UPI0006FDCB84|nr:hypothetical protein [Sphingomonas sp. Leaf357]KQS04725.1 hypothetical protein ASG11_11085 [Sphingomonas sp. Leaf357]
MRISRTNSARLAIAVCLIGAGIPALGQDSPESLLPPGFNDPATPRPRPTSPGGLTLNPSTLGRPAPSSTPVPTPSPGATPAATDGVVDPVVAAVLADAQAAAAVRAAEAYARALSAHRSLDTVGVAGPQQGALAPDALRGADGIYVEELMRRLNAPIASRWLSMALRKTLVSRLDTPERVNGADFAAERAWLLVRMGESVAGRAVAQSVDPENSTPKLYNALMQTGLATGDPGAFCPVADKAAASARERGWVVAKSICAALAGQPATQLLAANEKAGAARGIDMLLARKVAGMGARGRQAVTIEWDSVDQLTAWRIGMALASGTDIPDRLIATVNPRVQAWRALSPMVDVRTRIAPADYAAARGVLSNAAMVDLYGALDNDDDQASAELGIARDLRTAYSAGTRAERMTALTGLWDEPKTADGRYARLILTARAAARLPLDTQGADVDRLVKSMLSAGLDRSALRWSGKADKGGDAWAMLALADLNLGARYSIGDINGYSGKDDSDGLKRRMLFAGLAGLGRLSRDDIASGAESLGVRIGAENSWTRAIDRAARNNQPGLVVLLASIGMQTTQWRGVPPEVLYRTIGAMRAVGLGGQARMIAVEAIARL